MNNKAAGANLINIFFLTFIIIRSDKSLTDEGKQQLISDIEMKLDQKPMQKASHRKVTGETIVTNGMTPINDYEQLRRRIRSNILEMYSFATSEMAKTLKKAQPFVPELDAQIESMMSMAAEHKRSLINDMDRLRRLDGYEQWRQQESEQLSDLVQRRLRYLQNPADCSQARKLVCRLNKVGI